MDVIFTLIWFVVALGGLVAIHEFGHFWVARRFGIQVLRFSVGFGKPLWRTRDRLGTEYWIAMIPLGGYVKLLDARESDIPPELQHAEFSQRPVQQRLLVYLAGPGINLLFAWLIYWGLFIYGTETLVPKVGLVVPHSLAAQADVPVGAEVVGVGDQPTHDWEDVNLALAAYIGQSDDILLQLRMPDQMPDQVLQRTVSVKHFMRSSSQSPLAAIGIVPEVPDFPAIIGELTPGGAAERSGLKVGDHVIGIDQSSIRGWQHWVQWIRAYPGETLLVEVMRPRTDGSTQSLSISVATDALLDEAGERIGRVGAAVSEQALSELYSADHLRRLQQHGPIMAAVHAWQGVVDRVVLTLETLGKMLVGRVSVDNLSGPITIAQVAGETARYGVESFVNFVAYLSISLGVLNLLPIPVLDGGHILFGCIEWIRGKPLSAWVQQVGLNVGVVLLVSVMLLALYNDVARWVL